jgi:hypothetical protein
LAGLSALKEQLKRQLADVEKQQSARGKSATRIARLAIRLGGATANLPFARLVDGLFLFDRFQHQRYGPSPWETEAVGGFACTEGPVPSHQNSGTQAWTVVLKHNVPRYRVLISNQSVLVADEPLIAGGLDVLKRAVSS